MPKYEIDVREVKPQNDGPGCLQYIVGGFFLILLLHMCAK